MWYIYKNPPPTLELGPRTTQAMTAMRWSIPGIALTLYNMRLKDLGLWYTYIKELDSRPNSASQYTTEIYFGLMSTATQFSIYIECLLESLFLTM
jgi:hypothetical protein